MPFKNYRIYRRIHVVIAAYGNSDSWFDPEFTPTRLTLRARTDKEAKRKAEKMWEDGQYGPASIIAVEVDLRNE